MGPRGWKTTAAILLTSALVSGALFSAPSSAVPPSDTSACPRAKTRAALKSFLAAFNSGDFTRLDSLFAGEPEFQWYASGDPGRRLRAAAKNRRTLIPYFERRRARGDRMRSLSIDFNRSSPRWSNFALELERSVPSFRGGDWLQVSGKGAAICDEGNPQLIVLALNDAQPDEASARRP